ncbi:MAG: short-chain fatty acyl-CoA regulator family protein [Pseudoxanthomonas sp.]
MTDPSRHLGVRVQKLRERHALGQAALARMLGISASYLNQIERNQRPLTLAVRLRLEALFGHAPELADDEDPAALAAELRGVLADVGHGGVSLAELKALAANQAEIAHVLIELHRAQRANKERADALAQQLGAAEQSPGWRPDASEQVRDYFNRRQNHVAELDDLAEALCREQGFVVGRMAPRIRQRLSDRHGVLVETVPGELPGKRRFDAEARVLRLPDYLKPGQQAFQMAAQLALLEQGELIDRLIAEAGFDDAERIAQARIGLSNYFAGALVMPYGEFLRNAEACRHDIEWLAQRFGVGFEAVCHRLTTLHRRGAAGLPFFFVRVDRAGNVSKRHSATDFHFSHVGGSCPLWIVYEAFNQPGRVLTQVARMPDGRRHFWIARQVSSGPAGYGQPRKTFAVSLGCDLHLAERLIYAEGLDLHNPGRVTPIGPGCKVCERTDCVQRAFPALRGAG